MAKDGDRTGHDVTPIGIQGSIRPKSFLDVVSIVQNYYLAEKDGYELPDNLLTLKGKMLISEVGLKGAAISALISIPLTPLLVGVVERFIPIFGSYAFGFFDQAFAVVLALSFGMGYSLIVTHIGKFYAGRLTKRAINYLVFGLMFAAGLKLILATIIYNSLYATVLQEGRVARYLLKFYPYVSYETLDEAYRFIMTAKPVLLTSTSFVFLSTSLMIAVPWVGIVIGGRRAKRTIAREKMWQ